MLPEEAAQRVKKSNRASQSSIFRRLPRLLPFMEEKARKSLVETRSQSFPEHSQSVSPSAQDWFPSDPS